MGSVALRAIVLIAMTTPFVGCQTFSRPGPVAQAPRVDAARGMASADGKTTWYDALDIGVEGRGWSEGLKHSYDRFPAEAEGKIPDPVWNLSHHSAGINVRFMTDSPSVSVRWSLREDRIAMPHMPATGVSGVDLYVKHEGRWGWIGTGFPEKKEGNEAVLASGLPAGMHEYRMYFPLYNGTEKLEIGIAQGSTITTNPGYGARYEKPMLFWGSSILHGACASRPGMAYPSIIGRRMERPVINLGFSGNGRMDPPIVELISRLDVSVYVIDCCPNMDPALITERTEPLVKTLRAARPDTPIVLVENVPYEKGWFLDASKDSYVKKNEALHAAYTRLRNGGVRRLYYIPCDEFFGDDHDATVDGVHPNDIGFLRMADAIEPSLRRVLSRK
ncbi:MAG: SGNH/GDSL hydrolase family protein [Candidatus Hydrogenedentes bacterium]|nr:SGNH/GDSL hydrolase family protein [Candidatus Hydrogenedentota bacterium]